MRVVNISKFEDSLVIHFDTQGYRINAYTLASTLIGFADAAKAANASINHGYDVEIVVEAIGPGSFRAKISAIYTKGRNLFSDVRVQAVILGVLANFIYERTFSTDDDVIVNVQPNEVIVERGDDRVIVPRAVYDATRDAEKSKAFTQSINRTLDTISSDTSIQGVGFLPDMVGPDPEVMIPRSRIQAAIIADDDEASERIIEEICDLQIVRAILEQSKRKWEFRWRGVRISAPVFDDKFFTDFNAHRITIAPGDELRVRLAIKQSRHPQTGVFTNIAYEVVEVIRFVPRMTQMSMGDGTSVDTE